MYPSGGPSPSFSMQMEELIRQQQLLIQRQRQHLSQAHSQRAVRPLSQMPPMAPLNAATPPISLLQSNRVESSAVDSCAMDPSSVGSSTMHRIGLGMNDMMRTPACMPASMGGSMPSMPGVMPGMMASSAMPWFMSQQMFCGDQAPPGMGFGSLSPAGQLGQLDTTMGMKVGKDAPWPRTKAQVRCRNYEKTGCNGQARTLGGVGRHHYAYYCIVCRDTWAQLRPSAIGNDGNLHIRETKRKAPPLPDAPAKVARTDEADDKEAKANASEAQVSDDGSGFSQGEGDQNSPGEGSGSHEDTASLHTWSETKDTADAGERDSNSGEVPSHSGDVSQSGEARSVNYAESVSTVQSATEKDEGISVVMAQSLLKKLERLVFGTSRIGDIQHRLRQIEEELGLPAAPSSMSILERLRRVRG